MSPRQVFQSAILLVLLGLFSPARAQLATSDEYSLKAAFLYNIARMVEWPEQAETFRICFYGEDLFDGSLQTISGKKVREHSLEFKRNLQQQATTENIEAMRQIMQGCEMLFVSQQIPPTRWPDIFAAATDLPLLLLGEIEGFAQQGGMVNLLRDGDRIKIQINLRKAEQVSLSISSRLLTLAELVESQE